MKTFKSKASTSVNAFSKPVNRILSKFPNMNLLEPLEYPQFVHLMNQSILILTDSGGVQEGAPSVGKPVLVMRDTTEGP